MLGNRRNRFIFDTVFQVSVNGLNCASPPKKFFYLKAQLPGHLSETSLGIRVFADELK